MNPFHWFTGTAAINQADMAAKGRSLYGSRNGHSRLSEVDVMVIKYDLLPLVATGSGYTRAGQLTIQDIANRYGVSKALIDHIRASRTWRHV
jgi:hypothetical protein